MGEAKKKMEGYFHEASTQVHEASTQEALTQKEKKEQQKTTAVTNVANSLNFLTAFISAHPTSEDLFVYLWSFHDSSLFNYT